MTRECMKTVDQEFKLAALDFMTRVVDQGKLFLFGTTQPACTFTHTAEDERGLGQGFYNDAMVVTT